MDRGYGVKKQTRQKFNENENNVFNKTVTKQTLIN